MRKERFPTQRRSKLNPRRDGTFQILKKINGNAYKVDLLGEYSVSATFNVADLSLFDVGEDSRSNPFKDRGNDESFSGSIGEVTVHNPLNDLDGPITRSRAKKIKEAMVGLVQSTWAKFGHPVNKTSTFKLGFNKEGVALINLIQATEELG